jgi:hypothetical protein
MHLFHRRQSRTQGANGRTSAGILGSALRHGMLEGTAVQHGGGSMGEVVYRSQVTVTRHAGRYRTATLPAEDRPIAFGVHGAVAQHYGVAEGQEEPHATTLDYLVAAAAAG